MSISTPKPGSALPTHPGRTIVRGDEAAAWRNGFGLLAEARRAADEIIAAAQETYREQHERGYADGFEQGVEEASRLNVELSAKVDAYLASIERDVTDLALGIVWQVLASSDRGEVVAQAAANALEAFRREKFVKISVHPDLVDEVRERLSADLAANGVTLALDVVPEPGLEPYGCIVASAFAVVDAGLEVQLRAIGEALKNTSRARTNGAQR